MATTSRVIAQLDSGLVVITLFWDDVTLQLLSLSVVNNDSRDATLSFTKSGNTTSRTFAAGSTTSFDLTPFNVSWANVAQQGGGSNLQTPSGTSWSFST